MKINYIFRSKKCGFYSLENVFKAIIPYVNNSSFTIKECYMPENRANIPSVFSNIIYAHKQKSDIYHITGDVHYVVIGIPGDKTVLTIHDMVGLETTKGIKHFLAKLFWFTIPIRKCRFITVISQKTYNDVITLYPKFKYKIRVIPDPVGDQFTAQPYVFNEENPEMLIVGTKENKNLYRVADAIKGIKCRLVVIGRMNKNQKEYIEKLDISYVNRHDLSDEEIVQVYRDCDMVIFASTYEGFGMPIIEAQAIGRPVITSNIEPMLSVSGGAAVLVNPFDELSIRDGIKKLINNASYRDEIIEKGYINAEKYRPYKIAKEYVKLYKSFL